MNENDLKIKEIFKLILKKFINCNSMYEKNEK
jgi:hypothetical protein